MPRPSRGPTETLVVRITPDLKSDLQRVANSQNMTMTAFLEDCLAKGVRAYDNEWDSMNAELADIFEAIERENPC